MQTECSAERSMFGRVEGRSVVAEFDGGALTSDAGGLLLGAADQRLGLVRRIARCFRDARDPRLVEHSVATLIGQRVFGIALGYEDLNDHDELRHDPLMAVLAGKLEARREDCAPVAGKSTLNRLELSRETPTKYCKIAHERRSRPVRRPVAERTTGRQQIRPTRRRAGIRKRSRRCCSRRGSGSHGRRGEGRRRGSRGTVRNLVCGAIVTPMEGAYGNQERDPGRFAGGA